MGRGGAAQAPKRWTSYPALLDAYTGLGDHKAVRRTLERLQGLRSGTAAPAVMARAAGVYRDRGWREDAQAALADAAARAATPAEEAEWQYRAGELAWERGEPADALRHFEAALRLDPGLSSARAGEGRALAALGRTREALSAYRAALAKQPSPQYALELGELYDSLGRSAEARAQYAVLRARVAKEQAGGVDGELLLGRFEADHGDAGSAVRRLRAEWARQPGLEVADALGWAMHRAGRSEEALAWAKRATDKEHGAEVRSALYVYHRGMIERELGLAGPARRHLEEALRINPYFSPVGARRRRRPEGTGGSWESRESSGRRSRNAPCPYDLLAVYRLPRLSCSRSIASKRALKLPLPKPIEPCRSMISKKTVGRSWTGLVKIWSR